MMDCSHYIHAGALSRWTCCACCRGRRRTARPAMAYRQGRYAEVAVRPRCR